MSWEDSLWQVSLTAYASSSRIHLPRCLLWMMLPQAKYPIGNNPQPPLTACDFGFFFAGIMITFGAVILLFLFPGAILQNPTPRAVFVYSAPAPWTQRIPFPFCLAFEGTIRIYMCAFFAAILLCRSAFSMIHPKFYNIL